MSESFVGRTQSSYEDAKGSYIVSGDGWQVMPEFVGRKIVRDVKRAVSARGALSAIFEEPDSKERQRRANRKELYSTSQSKSKGHVDTNPDPANVERLLAEQERRRAVPTDLPVPDHQVELFDFDLDEEFSEELSSDSA